MGVRLIRTDRNGTKYYEDDRCPRCGGRGYIPEYAYIEGGVCFQCQGSGIGYTTWKEMTPEYTAKLNAQREAREKKKADAFNAHISEHYKALGLDENGHAHVVLAKTAGRSEELKAAGARFNGAWWYFNHSDETWETADVDAVPFLDIVPGKEICKWNGDCIEWQGKQLFSELLSKKRTESNKSVVSEFYGNVGDKVQVTATITGVFCFEVNDPYSWNGDTKTMYGYKMADAAGHFFVWITGSKWPGALLANIMGIDLNVPHSDEEQAQTDYWTLDENGVKKRLKGMNVLVKGSIKDHKERENIKETVLTRCKVKAA